MKKDPYGIVGFVLLFGVLFLGYLHAQPPVDPKSIFITDAPVDSFTITSYKAVVVGTWFEMRNLSADEKGFKYGPTEVRVVVKNEPIVTAKDNGTWEITFKERAP